MVGNQISFRYYLDLVPAGYKYHYPVFQADTQYENLNSLMPVSTELLD